MMDNPEQITYFAETDSRNQRIKFGIKAKDRARHVYVIGKTGMGKSTLLENMAIQDIQNGNGLAFIDPHGSSAEKLLDYVPEERIRDVLYFAPFDMEFPIAFNVMEDVGYDKRHLVVSGLMSAFKKIWVDTWSARMEYILSNVLLALLEYPDSTLLDVNRMLVEKGFRKKVVEYITDPIVKSFWVDEFANYTDRYTQEATPAIQNKVGQFTSNPLIRNIVGQPQSTFDLREMMDQKKVIIVNLSKGRMGETNADLLGSMLTTKIYLAAMSRADLPEHKIAKLPSFYFYVDEFQSVANDSFSDILSEARKYKLSLTIAHQYVEQMEENVRNAVFGNVGTIITFRVGPFDAEVLKTIFEPHFFTEDLVNLGFAQVYLTLMIDRVGSQPFSAKTLPRIEEPRLSYSNQIIAWSRQHYARARRTVEEQIKARGITKDPEEKKKERDKGKDRLLRRPREESVRRPEDRPPRPPDTPRPSQAEPALYSRENDAVSLGRERADAQEKDKDMNRDRDAQAGATPSKPPHTSSRERLPREPQERALRPDARPKVSHGERRNELKDALAKALQNHRTDERNKDSSSTKEKESPVDADKSGALSAKKESLNQNREDSKEPHEIPEDVLRSMLKVEDEKKKR